MSSVDHKWERIISDHPNYTYRLVVPGGWLYKVKHHSEFCVVFVPEPPARTPHQ